MLVENQKNMYYILLIIPLIALKYFMASEIKEFEFK